jgi:4-amino-4-deoxy-L-arabinose transferase-like glycosyltransferase
VEGSSAVLGGPSDRHVSRSPDSAESRLKTWCSASLLLAVSALAVLASQRSLDLLTMDDLREVEVAREMLETGDVVVPHLAGLPFVEKPPGFPILLSLAFRVVGHASAPAARFVAAAFALLSLAAVFLLGQTLAGPRAGALAALLLSACPLFCRTAHTVLLDNALTAALAWALYFGWLALAAEDRRLKRRYYAASLLAVGISFLFKGFVGPAIAGAAFLSALALAGRWRELRCLLHPMPIAAFLVPALLWVVPFVRRAPGPLLYEFFVANHVGRALAAYESHSRPLWFYASTFWVKFAPASLFLPFAAGAAWKRRAEPWGGGPLFLLAAALGGFLILSLPKAKDDVYLLPVYPAMAVLVADWLERRLTEPAALWPAGLGLAGAALAALSAVAYGARAGASAAPAIAGGAMAVLLGLAAGIRALRAGDRASCGVAAASLIGASAILCVVPPIMTWYVRARDPKPALLEIARLAGERELLLYNPDDRLRGGAGIYRNRTALEVKEARTLVERLRDDPAALAALLQGLGQYPELEVEAARLGLTLEERHRVPPAGLCPTIALVGIRVRP